MTDGSSAEIWVVLAILVGLLLIRAVTAALEAALVAVGVPRAQALAATPGARTRDRALAALAADPEATAFALRCASTFSILLVGLCAGVQGAWLAPSQARWAVGPVAALAAGLLSLPLAALARGLGAAH